MSIIRLQPTAASELCAAAEAARWADGNVNVIFEEKTNYFTTIED